MASLAERENLAWSLFDLKRYEEAERLLHELADEGSAYSSLFLGIMSETATVRPTNIKVAKYYYERAGREGDPEGYLRLGYLLSKQGELAQARAAYEAGAESGNVGSIFRLGRMVLKGDGGLADAERAEALFKCAAKEGHLYSQGELLRIATARSRSLVDKLLFIPRMIRIARKVYREMRRNGGSRHIG